MRLTVSFAFAEDEPRAYRDEVIASVLETVDFGENPSVSVPDPGSRAARSRARAGGRAARSARLRAPMYWDSHGPSRSPRWTARSRGGCSAPRSPCPRRPGGRRRPRGAGARPRSGRRAGSPARPASTTSSSTSSRPSTWPEGQARGARRAVRHAGRRPAPRLRPSPSSNGEAGPSATRSSTACSPRSGSLTERRSADGGRGEAVLGAHLRGGADRRPARHDRRWSRGRRTARCPG